MATYAGRYDEPLLKYAGGRLVPATEATVTVYKSDGETLATLYTSRSKVTEAANPLTPDSFGNLQFFADPGAYVLSVAEDSIVQDTHGVTVPFDPAEVPTDYAAKDHAHEDYQPLSAVLTATTASFTTADETKLDGIEVGATADQTASEIVAQFTGTPNGTLFLRDDGTLASVVGASGATNLAWDAATSTVTSDTGNDATLTAVTGTNPGLMTVAQKSKLDGIEAGADVTDAANVAAAGAHMAGGTDVPVADGGTGASTAAAARSNLGVYSTGEVDGAIAPLLSTADAPELIRDTMGTALVAGTNITITPNDGADTITIDAASSSTAYTRSVPLPIWAALANTNWASIQAEGQRVSSGAQNASVTFGVAVEAGTYTFHLAHQVVSNRGIYTVELSSNDGGAFVSLTSLGGSTNTVDGYSASAARTLSSITGIALTAGRWQVRLTMATKNASSSSYFGDIYGGGFVRTGA